jgi:hypothetical protein
MNENEGICTCGDYVASDAGSANISITFDSDHGSACDDTFGRLGSTSSAYVPFKYPYGGGCPVCDVCPCCGRPRRYARPWYPYNPWYPWYVNPWQQLPYTYPYWDGTWTNSTGDIIDTWVCNGTTNDAG